MWQKVVDYGAGVLLGGAGLALFFYVAFHWRAVCRRIDQHEARKNRFIGHSEKYIAFTSIFTPVYLIISMLVLFVGSVALMVGCGAPIITAPHAEEQKGPSFHRIKSDIKASAFASTDSTIRSKKASGSARHTCGLVHVELRAISRFRYRRRAGARFWANRRARYRDNSPNCDYGRPANYPKSFRLSSGDGMRCRRLLHRPRNLEGYKSFCSPRRLPCSRRARGQVRLDAVPKATAALLPHSQPFSAVTLPKTVWAACGH